MELPSNSLKQNAFITRLKIEQHMLIVMDKITYEEHPSQPLQTKKTIDYSSDFSNWL